MISKDELIQLAEDRLIDSKTLLESNRYDGAFYLCGYVIELCLKLRICKTLGWEGFPNTNKEFQDLKSFKTHKLDILLALSGIEENIKNKYFAEWSIVVNWTPEARYEYTGANNEKEAKLMIHSAEKLIQTL